MTPDMRRRDLLKSVLAGAALTTLGGRAAQAAETIGWMTWENLAKDDYLAALIEKLPPHLRRDPAVEAVQAELTHHPIDIFHLIYRDKPYELESKDYEFSRAAV